MRTTGYSLAVRSLTRGVLVACSLLTTLGCWAPLRCPAIPACQLPEEFRTPQRAVGDTINLSWLTQEPPDDYLLSAGDVLEITVPGLYARAETSPLRSQIMANGRVDLPLIGSVELANLNLSDAQRKINHAYADGHLRNPAATLVLSQKASISIVVLGEVAKPGVLVLSKYENDVGHAIAMAGGITQDASDTIEVHRHRDELPHSEPLTRETMKRFRVCGDEGDSMSWTESGGICRIPLRADAQPRFRREDIILNAGDVVTIPSRRHEVFYVVGKLNQTNTVRFTLGDRERELGVGFILPRDREIDVVTAVAMAGYIDPIESPTTVTVHRSMPDGSPLLIRVDLIAARYDRRETILVHPGDIIYLNPDKEWYFRRTFDRVVDDLVILPFAKLLR